MANGNRIRTEKYLLTLLPEEKALLEKNALMVFDTLYNIEPQRNAKGMFTNHHLNVEKIISTSNMYNVAVYSTSEISPKEIKALNKATEERCSE